MTVTMPYITGIAMSPFGKSRRTLSQLTEAVVARALADARVAPGDVDLVVFANAVGGLLLGQEMIRGQVFLRDTGLLGTPIVNVENACASGASALAVGAMAIGSESARTVLVVGAEKLAVADKGAAFAAIGSARDVTRTTGEDSDGRSPFMDIYAREAREYARLSGATSSDFALVSVKNRRHGALNPDAQFRSEVTADEVASSRMIVEPLRLLMCSPISDGAAAVVLSAGPDAHALRLRAVSLVSGTERSAGQDDSAAASASARAAAAAYEQADIGPEDVDVVELHDAVAPAELMAYEDLGLAKQGAGPELIRSGATALGGRLPVNPSGGLLARGHPIGATGCAQIVELATQLRHDGGGRQVGRTRVALAHNVGGWLGQDGAAAAVTIIAREAR